MYYCRAHGAIWKEKLGAFPIAEEGD